MILFILKGCALRSSSSKTPWDFITRFVVKDQLNILIEDSSKRSDQKNQTQGNELAYVDLTNLNNCRSIRNYLEIVSSKLQINGVFIGCVETHDQRLSSQKINKVPIVRTLNKGYEFIFHRVFPKTKGIRHVYNWMTQRKNRRLTKTEVLGRLVWAGFSIIDVEDEIDGRLFFAVKKVKDSSDNRNPGFGLLYKMPRVGMHGKIINVYKFRTMHPFAEYVQSYIYEKNGTKDGDKLIDDFRVSKWGRILRKYWIDELPMVLNLLRNDLKLVGIRPLSRHKFDTYPMGLQELRVKTKPGLFPPYYADLPKNQADFFKSEEKYLRSYIRFGRSIDRKYFFYCLNNIVIKMKRSA